MRNRIPPHDLAAEESVLGAILESHEAVANCSEIVKPDDFYKPQNRALYETILALFGAGEPVNAITAADALTRSRPENLGDIRVYIAGLIHDYPTASAAPEYAAIVAEMATLRRLIEAGGRIMEMGFSKPENVGAAVAEAEWAVLKATRDSSTSQQPTRRLSEYFHEDLAYFEELNRLGSGPIGLSSGLPTLDKATYGWQPGQLIVIGAQSGHGKTTVLQHFATTASRAGKTVLFVSLEMSGREMRDRMYSAEEEINHKRLKEPPFSTTTWTMLQNGMSKANEWDFFLTERKGQTSADISADARRIALRHGGIDLIVVDYLQYVTPQDFGIPREQQVGRIARELKDTAGLLGCPVVTGCQLNDQVNHRADKRPTMTDIRESKGIEHTADVILFGFWPWRHNNLLSAEGKQWDYELILAKHRQGVTDMAVACEFKAWCFAIAEKGANRSPTAQMELAR